MKKFLKLLPILILLLCFSFLAFLTFKFFLGEVLLPKSQMNYSIHTHKASLEPRTLMRIQVTSESGLLLSGKDVWIMELNSSKDSITYGETTYYYDIKKQVVSVYGEDKNGETVNREVPADIVDGVKLHKDGIVITSKDRLTFSMEKGKDYNITLQNISDKPLTFTVFQEQR